MVPGILDVGTDRSPAHQSRATSEIAIAIIQKRILAIVQNPIVFADNRRTHNPVTGLVVHIHFARACRFCAGDELTALMLLTKDAH